MSPPTSYALPRIIIIMVECMLYGAYAVLFGIAVWILPRKFHVPSVKRIIFPAIMVLFSLATINIAYDLVGEAYAILFTIPVVEKLWMKAGQSVDLITFTLADFVGDSVLFFRVYTVWGFQKRVPIALLLLLLLPTKFLGILATIGEVQLFNGSQGSFFSWRPGFLFLFMAINPFVNLSMTLLIAGRVWLMSRDIRHTSGSNLYHWYNRAWAVIIESGLIYPIFLILEARLGFISKPAPAPDTPLPNFTTLGVITAGIAPTLIAVRVGLGSSIYSQMSSIRPTRLAFAAPPRSEVTHVLDMAPIGDTSHLSDSTLNHVGSQGVGSLRVFEDLEVGPIQGEGKRVSDEAKVS